jgi:RNA polymerase sigma-70 factor (ECF subfamily)
MSTDPDFDLLERSRQGDILAFKALIQLHEGKVAGVIHAMLGFTAEAEDVGQEVFIRFYQSLGKFEGKSSLGTYLVRIAINLSINELRKRKKSLFYYSKDYDSKLPSGEESMDTTEFVNYAIQKLEPDFKAVVTLRLIEGYSTEETATILGIPIGTVLSRLSRAQKQLKEILSKLLKV